MIEDWRRKIDQIDAQILKLLNRRTRCAIALGQEKKRRGLPIRVPKRERELLKRLAAKNSGPLDHVAVRRIFKVIIAESRRLEARKASKSIRVAFQGELGAYSHQAICKRFGRRAEVWPCRTFKELFQKVKSGKTDAGVVPIENSTTGKIKETQELLKKHKLRIAGEISLRVRHCLLAHKGSALEHIKHVYTHPQALKQCVQFLTQLKAQTHAFYDTAGAAKWVKESKRKDAAAIAGKMAAEVYHLAVLKEGIESSKENRTRFLIVT